MSLLKISLVTSLTGIFILFLISNSSSPPLLTINQTTNDYLNKEIQIRVKIIDEKQYGNNFKILTLEDSTGTIQATLNSKNKIKHYNKTLTIIARVIKYNNELELEINKIIFS